MVTAELVNLSAANERPWRIFETPHRVTLELACSPSFEPHPEHVEMLEARM